MLYLKHIQGPSNFSLRCNDCKAMMKLKSNDIRMYGLISGVEVGQTFPCFKSGESADFKRQRHNPILDMNQLNFFFSFIFSIFPIQESNADCRTATSSILHQALYKSSLIFQKCPFSTRKSSRGWARLA